MGKSSGQTTGYKYFMDLHFVVGLGHGGSPTSAVPDGLLQILAGDRIAWNGLEVGIQKDSGTIELAAPELFGGDEKEGGLAGTLEILFGGPTQPVNGYLQSIQGSPQSAYRGVFSAVYRNGQVCSNNPYIKPWSFLRRRITGDWAGGACWYEETAPILLEGGAGAGAGGIDSAGILVCGSQISGSTALWCAIGPGLPPTFYPIEQTTGADLGAATPTYATVSGGKSMWVAATQNGVRYSEKLSGPWLSGSISADGGLTALTHNINGWAAFTGTPSSCSIYAASLGGDSVAFDLAFTAAGTYPTITNDTPPDDSTFFLLSCRRAWQHQNAHWRSGAYRLFKCTEPMSGEWEIVWKSAETNADDEVVWFADMAKAGVTTYGIAMVGIHVEQYQVRTTPDGGATWPDSGIVWSESPVPGTKPYELLECGGHVVALANGGELVTSANGWGATISHGMQKPPAYPYAEDIAGGRRMASSGGLVYIIGAGRAADDGGGAGGGDQLSIFDPELQIMHGPYTMPITLAWGITGDGAPRKSTSGLPVSRYCMNPAHVIYQCITDPENGLGYPSAVIDDASFRAAAAQLYAEGLGVNLRWTQQTSIEDFIGIAQDHAGGLMVRDRRTGLFKFKLLRKDYDKDDLPIFGPHNCRIVGDAQRPSPADTVNELQVTYTDYRTGKEATTTVRNVAGQQAVGRIISKPHSLTGLPTEALAQRRGMMDLDAMSLPLWRFDLAFNRDADTLEPGSVFRFQWPPMDLDIVLRVPDEIDYGTAANGEIRAKCIEDVFSLPDAVYTGSVGAPDNGPDGTPEPAVAQLFEVPYRDLVPELTPTALADLPDDAGYVAASAVRPASDQQRIELHTRLAPAAFARAASGDFCGSAVLTAATLPLNAGIAVRTVVDPDRVHVGMAAFIGEGNDAEMVRIDARWPGMWVVARGCGDTTPKAWPAGTRIWVYDDYSAGDPSQYIDGETVDGKVLTTAALGTLALDDADALNVTLASRAVRPYPPGNVQVNGIAALSGDPTPPATPPGQGDPGDPTPPAADPEPNYPAVINGSLPDGYVGESYRMFTGKSGAGMLYAQAMFEAYGGYWEQAFRPSTIVRNVWEESLGVGLSMTGGIPLTAETAITNVELLPSGPLVDGVGYPYIIAQSITIAAKPTYAMMDWGRISVADTLALVDTTPAWTTAKMSSVSNYAFGGLRSRVGAASGKVRAEFTIVGLGVGMYVWIGVLAGGENMAQGYGVGSQFSYMASTNGTYAVELDAGTGAIQVFKAGTGSVATSTLSIAASYDGTYHFGWNIDYPSPDATVKTNMGNEAWVITPTAGFGGVPNGPSIIPVGFDGGLANANGYRCYGTKSITGVSPGPSGGGGLVYADPAFGKSTGKYRVGISAGTAGRSGLCKVGHVGIIGVDAIADCIAFVPASSGDRNYKIETRFGGVTSTFTIPAAIYFRAPSLIFACDFDAHTVAIYYNVEDIPAYTLAGVISGLPSGAWLPAIYGPGVAGASLIGNVTEPPSFADWTITL